MQQVPNPQSKNFGPGNQNLLSEESSGGSRAANVTISFGQLGSYTYNQPKLIPAPAEQLQPTVQSIPTKETAHVYKLSKDECKEALLKFASQGCCANKKPVEEGHMTDVNSYNALEYVLETYNEKRSLICTFAQCRPGETLNSLGAGQIPDPWSLACQPGATYNNEVRNITLPFTDCIQPCHACNSFGQLRCLGCGGDGRTTCNTCDGSKFTNRPNAEGAMVRVTCSSCGGNGQKTCVRCSGDGRTICNVCQGVQVLKWFLQVRVEYINHVDKYTKEKTDLPDELIATVKGEDLGTNEGRQVPPMADSDSKDVVDNSIRLIQKANQAYAQEKRVMQRHRLTCVTCSECALEHNGQTIKFWVYGQERKVYCPEYPGGCCCTIL